MFAYCEARVDEISDGMSRFAVAWKLGLQNNQHAQFSYLSNADAMRQQTLHFRPQ